MEHFALHKPFFEIGPKVYLHGSQAVELAKAADAASEKYDVDIIFSAQYTDITPVAAAVKRVKVFAQHMDPVRPGRGIGAVLPEALRDAGATGVLMNHAERPMSLSALYESIQRAHELGLAAMVCAGTPEEGMAAACLGPDIILAESPALIGTGKRGPDDKAEIQRINRMIRSIAPDIPILHGAGIHDEEDVYQIIRAGADATGSTSGIICASDPFDMLDRMICAVSRAWSERQSAHSMII